MATRELYAIVCIACETFNGREIRMMTIGTNIRDSEDTWYCERKISKSTFKNMKNIRVLGRNLCECTNMKNYYYVRDTYRNREVAELDVIKAQRRTVSFVNFMFRRGKASEYLTTM